MEPSQEIFDVVRAGDTGRLQALLRANPALASVRANREAHGPRTPEYARSLGVLGEVLLAAVLRPGQCMSAVELIDDEPEPEVDLWQIGHNGDKSQKEAELIREVQRSRQMTQREQICETVRKTANREMGMERCIER